MDAGTEFPSDTNQDTALPPNLSLTIFARYFFACVVSFILGVLLSDVAVRHGWFSRPNHSFVAVGTVIACSPMQGGSDGFQRTVVALKTPDNVFFTIIFKNGNAVVIPGNSTGEVHYHSSDAFYWFDSYRELHPGNQPPPPAVEKK